MLISQKYKERLQELAGIFLEIDMATKEKLFSKSNQRTPFNRDLMKQAILNGQEVGLSFQSNNSKYKMPVTKFRIIHPVTMGIDKNGNLVVRALHVSGQSEERARETNSRSAEVENEWRLFKVSNIKSMWLTGRYFRGPMPGYNPNDSAMTSIIATIDFNKAITYQDSLQEPEETQGEESENTVNQNITNTLTTS